MAVLLVLEADEWHEEVRGHTDLASKSLSDCLVILFFRLSKSKSAQLRVSFEPLLNNHLVNLARTGQLAPATIFQTLQGERKVTHHIINRAVITEPFY